jgi:SAM-dependent methyltransferase
LRFPKLKLTPRLLRLAYTLFDVESYLLAAAPHPRIIEYAYVLQKLVPLPPGKVLDVGCSARVNYLPAALASLGWQVTGIDIRPFEFEYPNFSFVRGDMRKTGFADGYFDAVYSVSSLEHFGLSGRYSIKEEDPEGDAKSVKEIWRVLRPDGKFIVTIPYGQREIVLPPTRIYDQLSLKTLFSGWKVTHQAYWVMDGDRMYSSGAAEAEQVKSKLGTWEATALLEFTRPSDSDEHQ